MKDRKNVRRVNKSWNKCCSIPSLIQNEKIVFINGCTESQISEILLKSNRLQMNLEFHGFIYPNHLPASIWQTCAYKISDLSFFYCDINGGTLKTIFLHCYNLQNFSIKNSKPVPYPEDEYEDNPDDTLDWPTLIEILDFFIKQNIRKTQLHTFTLLVKDGITPDILLKILIVFPCLRQFQVNFKRIIYVLATKSEQKPVIDFKIPSDHIHYTNDNIFQFLEDQIKTNWRYLSLNTCFSVLIKYYELGLMFNISFLLAVLNYTI